MNLKCIMHQRSQSQKTTHRFHLCTFWEMKNYRNRKETSQDLGVEKEGKYKGAQGNLRGG